MPGGDGALPRRNISRSTGRRRELAAGNALEVPGLARDGENGVLIKVRLEKRPRQVLESGKKKAKQTKQQNASSSGTALQRHYQAGVGQRSDRFECIHAYTHAPD